MSTSEVRGSHQCCRRWWGVGEAGWRQEPGAAPLAHRGGSTAGEESQN